MVLTVFSSVRRLIALGVVVVVLAALGWFLLQAYPVGGSGREEYVSVHYGDSLGVIANEMQREGVISSTFAFRVDLMLFGSPSPVPGTYAMPQGASFAELRSILSGAPNVLSVPSGYTLHEIAQEVAAHTSNAFGDQFVADETVLAKQSAFGPPDSLEGLVGPGNYVLSAGESPMELLDQMTTSFDHLASSLGLTPRTRVDGLDAYQLITAASIVEKEGYYPENMPKVARVIFNRLARGGPLQMDSTVEYYFNQDGGTVTPAMLATVTPYNTYLNVGLTPTPICTVSKYSLSAVLHAPAGPWLYFELVNKDGTMKFSATFAQQLAAEALAAKNGIS
ncbi:MAG: endolytic transglycosylase MltG [Acidimicrobiales bacterium]